MRGDAEDGARLDRSDAIVGSVLPDAGAVVVPLFYRDGEWAIEWDTIKPAASLPILSIDLPQEAFEVRLTTWE